LSGLRAGTGQAARPDGTAWIAGFTVRAFSGRNADDSLERSRSAGTQSIRRNAADHVWYLLGTNLPTEPEQSGGAMVGHHHGL